MGIDGVDDQRFQINRALTPTCWTDGAQVAHDLNLFARVQHVNIGWAHTDLLYMLKCPSIEVTRVFINPLTVVSQWRVFNNNDLDGYAH